MIVRRCGPVGPRRPQGRGGRLLARFEESADVSVCCESCLLGYRLLRSRARRLGLLAGRLLRHPGWLRGGEVAYEARFELLAELWIDELHVAAPQTDTLLPVPAYPAQGLNQVTLGLETAIKH